MITRVLAGALIVLVGGTVPNFAFAQNSFDAPDYEKAHKCIQDVQTWYADYIAKCLTNTSASLKKYQDPNAYQDGDLEKIQALTTKIQAEQKNCYEGEGLVEFKKRTNACYEYTGLGGVWDLPAVKLVLVNVVSDWRKLSPTEGQTLSACLLELSKRQDLAEISASNQERVSACFRNVGLNTVSSVYTTSAVVIDCAQARFPIRTQEDAVRFFNNQTIEDRTYIEQCVLKKVAPVVTIAAVANVPLVAGWKSIFLFGQLLITQPIVLLRKQKYKTWGTVFDASTLAPVDLSSVRLVETRTNKIIATAVTNVTGSYLFLAKPGTYRVEVNKSGYQFPSVLLAAGAFERDHYFGEPIVVQNEHDIIDRHVPIDPEAKPISIFKFKLRQWRYRVATMLGFVSPLISIIGFILVPKWWVGLLVIGHCVIFGIFLRLSIRTKTKKFGTVTDEHKKVLNGVQISLFRKQDNKLLGYYVTDLFGRYYFPRLVGEYFLIFKKAGFVEQKLEITVQKKIDTNTTFSFDVQLKKST